MLKGKYTGLRAIEKSDLPVLLNWRNESSMRRYFREKRELSMDHQIAWYENKVLADPSTRMFAIVDIERNELVGACGLCYIDWINRSAEFSMYIGKDSVYIDERYAKDAGEVLLNYGFDELNFHRIWTEVYEFDEKKRVLLNNLWFREEGRLVDNVWTEGRWVSSLIYGRINYT